MMGRGQPLLTVATMRRFVKVPGGEFVNLRCISTPIRCRDGANVSKRADLLFSTGLLEIPHGPRNHGRRDRGTHLVAGCSRQEAGAAVKPVASWAPTNQHRPSAGTPSRRTRCRRSLGPPADRPVAAPVRRPETPIPCVVGFLERTVQAGGLPCRQAAAPARRFDHHREGSSLAARGRSGRDGGSP